MQYKLFIIVLSFFLGSCGKKTSRYKYKRDHAPCSCGKSFHVKDAEPRIEAKSRYGNPHQYKVFNRTYRVLDSSHGFREVGYASWYGKKFHGYRTSSGEVYDMYSMTAAHKSLPLPTYVLVRNLYNNAQAIVKVNDRGPFHGDRIIDLSYAAATKLGVLARGTAKVEVIAINPQTWQRDQQKIFINDSRTIEFAKNSEKLYLQLGIFKEHSNALKLTTELPHHLNSQIDRIQNKGLLQYRVKIGPFKNRIQIETIRKNLIALQLPTGFIIG